MKIKLLHDNLQGMSPYEWVGKIANTCYMKGSFEEVFSQSQEKAEKRALKCGENGHHSVFDHLVVTLQIEGLNKITAMVLNSIGMYATSERSGRYCEFKGFCDRDEALYIKWREKILEELKDVPARTDFEKEKIANENARYFISSFAENTEMVYTINIRMLSYVTEWAEKAINYIDNNDNELRGKEKEFYTRLSSQLKQFNELVYKTIFNYYNFSPLKDNKNGRFDFLADLSENRGVSREFLNSSVFYGYPDVMSIVCLGHKVRSRVLDIAFGLQSRATYYIPSFIQSWYLSEEWIEDMKSIEDLFPQGLEVETYECGMKRDFFRYQVIERMCNHTLNETCQRVLSQAGRLHREDDSSYIKSFFNEQGTVKTKCQLTKCSNPCLKNKNFKNRIL